LIPALLDDEDLWTPTSDLVVGMLMPLAAFPGGIVARDRDCRRNLQGGVEMPFADYPQHAPIYRRVLL
jgi:hypothetical protein